MVTRRSLLVGSSAAVLGVAAARTSAAAAQAPATQVPVIPAAAASGFALPGGLFCPVPFMSRAAWGANESLRYTNNGGYWPEEYYPVQAITVHNTGFVPDPDPAQTVRDIYTRQTLQGDGSPGAVGWGDIGYNLLIDDHGVVYEGRYSGSDGLPVFDPSGAVVTGAHVKHYNSGNIGVCLIGYLNDAPATAAAQDSLVTVLAYLAAVGRVNPTGTVHYVNSNPAYSSYTKTVLGVSGHRNWAATDCPGNAMYPLLPGIRTRAIAAMPSPLPQPTSPQPSSSPTSEPAPTTAEPSPTDGSTQSPPTPTPSPTKAPSPTPHPSATKTGSGGRDRGGDEYVPKARKASPSAYPTVRATPTPSASAVPTQWTPAAEPTVAAAPTTPSLPPISSAGGSGWGVGATVVGVAAAGGLGLLGARWLRQRRASLETPADPVATELSTVDETPAESEPAEPTAPEEPAEPTAQAEPAEPSAPEEPAEPAEPTEASGD